MLSEKKGGILRLNGKQKNKKAVWRRQGLQQVKIWAEKLVIPTYGIGKPEKNPVFLEKRVYQGSSGKVYPYPVIETLSDEKADKEYQAVWLENEYLKVMILPELGGRIQRAYDKTNGYDFVYYNRVIKPALVGLTGPWISGGIEFNWPQHHRPTTFLPVDWTLQKHPDGSASVLLHDVDQMYGTRGTAKITLYPGKAYIEICGRLYNRTALPQTFLWWANPAVPANEHTRSIFPPDVHAVMDHGKRDVSRFPIATGVYYKMDYSEGVDISRYKNIPVPTSYMAEKSTYDFVGGYDEERGAGILHVADHHISPGKKQWTWGNGDFGRAWEQNLTDEDGPYVELMTGVYTDNQPDFSWLQPFEEKTFEQYFLPYKAVGQVKNATREAAVHLSCENGQAHIIVYATGLYPAARILLEAAGKTLLDKTVRLSPEDIYETFVPTGDEMEENLLLSVLAQEECLVCYRPEAPGIPPLPEPARAAEEPEEIKTNEELYLTGQHIEQYRHATYLPDPYYLLGLKRDPGDIRLNCAYGLLLLRRGCFSESEGYFRKAIERLTGRNPNPYDSEAYYLLGLSLFLQGKELQAYDAFYKAAWSGGQQEMAFYYLAVIDARRGSFARALAHTERALVKNAHHIKARALKAWLLRRLKRTQEAERWTQESLSLDPFDFVSAGEQAKLDEGKAAAREQALFAKLRGFSENYLMAARDYAEFGAYAEALSLLESCPAPSPLFFYYRAYYLHLSGQEQEVGALLQQAEAAAPGCCFPNKLEDIAVLRFALENGCRAKAGYYLGCLLYDKLQWRQALSLWEASAQADGSFPTVWRNLSLCYYNKARDAEKARTAMEKAFSLDETDARVFLELMELHKRLGMSFHERLARYEKHRELAEIRDDLYIEYITLLNLTGQHEKALGCIMGRRFHPWEGGEGKVTAQYTLALLEMAKEALEEKRFLKTEELLRRALVYPENLGEGKLEGTKDNHLYYYLGRALQAQGRAEQARACFERALTGTDEPAGAWYYNDQPADMILYQGLAYRELGQEKQARARFHRLTDYGEQHLEDLCKPEYFAVSLPDFLIFEEDYTKRNRAHCCYLIALGNFGLGNFEKAAGFLKQAQELDPSHMMCSIYGKLIGRLV